MRKKIILSVSFALACIISVNAQQTPPQKATNPNQAEIQFEEVHHDFGNIKEGTQATYEFKFKNIGKEPLFLTDVHASCGCTTPVWPKESIAPGKTGVVTATYDSQNRPGVFNKTIFVSSNAVTSSVSLTIAGFVESNPQGQPPIIKPVPPKP